MTVDARFVHTNLVARDWRRLARFYERVFGCTPVPPERDLAGQWVEDGISSSCKQWSRQERVYGSISAAV